MNCIVDACTSGKCACEPGTLRDNCVSVADTCSNLDLRCEQEKAECMDEEQSRSLPEANSTDAQRLVADRYAELRDLKEERCRLKLALDDGWLNAKKQLKAVEDKIERGTEYLTAMGQPLPEMHCEKDFEEWSKPSEVPPTSASSKASVKAAVDGAPADAGAQHSAGEAPYEAAGPNTATGEEGAEKQSSSPKQGRSSTLRIFLILFVFAGALSVIFCAMRTARS